MAGYYTLSQYSVELRELPEAIAQQLPRYPVVPVTLVGRLAVSVRFRGSGLGRVLLVDALIRSLEVSQRVASAGVMVDAKDESSAQFYRKYGFLDLLTIERRLFLPMKTIATSIRRGSEVR